MSLPFSVTDRVALFGAATELQYVMVSPKVAKPTVREPAGRNPRAGGAFVTVECVTVTCTTAVSLTVGSDRSRDVGARARKQINVSVNRQDLDVVLD